MKCSRCGHKTRTLAAMAAHVRKKHPGAMKRKHRVVRSVQSASKATVHYCPNCGAEINPCYGRT